MNPVERFAEYASAFEEAFKSDDWSVVEPYFTHDAVYEVLAEAPVGGKHEGREAVLAHFKASLDNFDRRFDSRALEVVEGPELREGAVWLRWRSTYAIAGAPEFAISGEESARFEGDRIKRLEDRFRAGSAESMVKYFAEHGANLHPVGGPR